MTFEIKYKFTRQSGSSYYSYETDEDFYDIAEEEYEYEVTTKDVMKAFLYLYSDVDATVNHRIKQVLEEVLDKDEIADTLKEFEVNLLDELVSAYDNLEPEERLEYILGDIAYFVEKQMEDLKDYFEDEAEEYFYKNKV